jgi:hypothetical protein
MVSGGEIIGGALSGAGAGASFGPIGAGIGFLAGGITSLITGKKRDKLKDEANRRQELITGVGDYFSDLASLQAFNNQYNGAYGVDMAQVGMPSQGDQFLISEPPKRLASDVVKIEGPDHSNGGVEVDADLDGYNEIELEGGEVSKGKRVFSKRLKVPMEFVDTAAEEGFTIPRGTYAKVAESLGRSKDKYEQKLQSIDQVEANTGMLMLDRIDNLYNILFYTQELSNLSKQR